MSDIYEILQEFQRDLLEYADAEVPIENLRADLEQKLEVMWERYDRWRKGQNEPEPYDPENHVYISMGYSEQVEVVAKVPREDLPTVPADADEDTIFEILQEFLSDSFFQYADPATEGCVEENDSWVKDEDELRDIMHLLPREPHILDYQI